MDGIKVEKYFEKNNLKERIHRFNSSSATVELASECLGCEYKRIAKTIAFMVNEQPILIVAAGDAKVDNTKYRDVFGIKAIMIDKERLLEVVGHAVGGVCPFIINKGVKVYLDISLKRFKSVFPACGSSNSAIELTVEELEQHSKYTSWIDVCKNWQ